MPRPLLVPLLLLLASACGASPAPEAPAPAAPAPAPAGSTAAAPSARPGPARGGPPAQGRGKAPAHRGPAPGAAPQGPPVSGAALQDPAGVPEFHAWPAPAGPAITALGDWSAPTALSAGEAGGYRPQLAAGPDGTLHALFYARTDAGDLIRHRIRPPGGDWLPARPLGFDRLRNWGPDLVVRDSGEVVVVFDHAQPDFSSRGWLTVFDGTDWSAPTPLTAAGGGHEIGSGHVAHGPGDALAYVWIGKELGPDHRFQAWWRWHRDGAWSAPVALTDGSADAWHTNVERRPDGSMLLGYDVGTGGAETVLYVAEGRDGAFGAPENLTATATPGERPHFAFGPDGTDHVAYFHKQAGRPLHVYVRSGRPGAWGPNQEPSRGLGGFHFDPDIAVDAQGRRVIVWGWDSGSAAELVYAVDTGSGWSAPRLVARLGAGKPGLPSIDVAPDGRFHVVWNQGVRGRSQVYHAALALP